VCSTAEKMTAPFRLLVHGRSGHASMPGIADNALVKATSLIRRLAEYRAEPRLGPEAAAFLEAIVGEPVSAQEAVERAAAVDPLAGDLVEPLLALTFSPTMISASQKRNVIPALCEVVVDCRLLPGEALGDAEALIRNVLGSGDYDFEWQEAQGGTRSPVETPLWDAVASFVAEIEPHARLVPTCLAGFTDSHWVRAAFGTVAYGFFPMRTMNPELASRLIHSADERIAVDDLELGVRFLRHAAQAIGA
jgi:acetylornithine deacetylase/succinyl-diaminopimelate desuccinylase-like protein